MGIGFVLLAWGIAGIAITGIFTGIAWRDAPYRCFGIEDTQRKKRLIFELRLFPIACFAWIVGAFIIQAIVNHNFLHRDIGIGDGFDCPLSNGYALSGIDVTDYMTLYNPTTLPEGPWGRLSNERTDKVDNVSSMQIAGKYMAGASSSNLFEQRFDGSSFLKPDGYFILDSRTGAKTNFKSLEQLQLAAHKLGFEVALRSVGDVYRQNRFSIFDQLVVLLQFGVPFLYRYSLYQGIAQARKPTAKIV